MSLFDLDVFRKNVSGTTTSGNKYLAVPTDFLSPFSLAVTVNGSTSFLLNKDVEYLQEYKEKNPEPKTLIGKQYAAYKSKICPSVEFDQ